MKAALPLFALLTACGQQAPSQAAIGATPAATPAHTAPPAPEAKAFAFDEENDLIQFHYGWSAEAAAVPQLVARFRKDMEHVKAELTAGAKVAVRDRKGFGQAGYMSSTDYETGGQSDRLLSLRVDVGSFTGGAHESAGTNALLWDRAASKEINVANLFAQASNMDRLLTQRWCDALNRAIEQKRGAAADAYLSGECPKLDELAIIPMDKDKNGRFDTLMLVASPYVAGPWVEGSYEIELAVTPDLIAALKGDYRGSFEAGQAQ